MENGRLIIDNEELVMVRHFQFPLFNCTFALVALMMLVRGLRSSLFSVIKDSASSSAIYPVSFSMESSIPSHSLLSGQQPFYERNQLCSPPVQPRVPTLQSPFPTVSTAWIAQTLSSLRTDTCKALQLVQQTQTTLREICVRRIDKNSAAQQGTVKIRHHRTDKSGRITRAP